MSDVREQLIAELKDREDWHPDDLANAVDAILARFLVVPRSDIAEPVGYIGLIKRPEPGGFDYDTPGAVWPTPPTWWVAHCREQTRRGDMEFVIGEIREVPDGR